MSVLLAVGTRKGLFLYRSDDRRTWTVDGPHFLMQEVASVAIDTRRATPRIIVGVMSWHWGPTIAWSDDLGATWHETENAAISFPADTDTALGRVWQIQPDTADRPDVVWAGCEPTSLWRSDDRGETFALVRELWDHPHRPEWAPGFGGAAVHTIVPDPASEKVTVAMSTGGVYVSDDGATGWTPRNRGIHVKFMPDEYPEFGQCVHKVAVDAGDPQRMYAQNHHGVYRSDDGGRQWTSIADGLPSDFGFFVLVLALPAGHRVGDAAGGRRAPHPGRGPDARPPHPRRRRHLDRARPGPARTSATPWCCATRPASTPTEPTGVYLGTRDGCVYASADEGETYVARGRPPARRAVGARGRW